jgi:murein DD-endopeptidase MepM/ murein hydrolase activator NlpD
MRFIFLLFTLLSAIHFEVYAQKKKKKVRPVVESRTTLESEMLASSKESALLSVNVSNPAAPKFIEQHAYCTEDWYQLHEASLMLEAYLNQFPNLAKSEANDSLSVEDPCESFRYITYENELGNTWKMHEKWFLADEAFLIWDTRNVNPYQFNLSQLPDSVPIVLFEQDAWAIPLKNTKVNSKFGMRRWRWHHGTDLDLNIGDSIYAAFDGVVRLARYNHGGYGNYVMLRHANGLETLYGHLHAYLVEPGQEVKAGELIGLGGNTGRSTGPHLHYEVRYKGHAFDPTRIYDFDQELLTVDAFVLTKDYFKEIISMKDAAYHKIRPGDTLSGISAKYGTSVARICQLNGMSKNTVLHVGKSLRVR